jgi:hypothetical protein
VLLVVTDKVLDGGTDVLGLQTVDVGCGDQTRVSGVFGEGLERSTTEGRSLDVDSWGEEADGVSGLGLGGEESTGLVGELLGEGGTNGRGVWQSRGGR